LLRRGAAWIAAPPVVLKQQVFCFDKNLCDNKLCLAYSLLVLMQSFGERVFEASRKDVRSPCQRFFKMPLA
jgi:hypothetical protein